MDTRNKHWRILPVTLSFFYFIFSEKIIYSVAHAPNVSHSQQTRMQHRVKMKKKTKTRKRKVLKNKRKAEIDNNEIT